MEKKKRFDHPMYDYLNNYRRDGDEFEKGFMNLGEIELGLDSSEQSYYDEHCDNDLDKDDL